MTDNSALLWDVSQVTAIASLPAEKIDAAALDKFWGDLADKNARIANNVKILNKRGLQHDDQDQYCIRDGIVVVMKNAVLKSGTVI